MNLPASPPDHATLDRQEIAQLIENWMLWRNGCLWAKVRSTYTPEATMDPPAALV
jgi:hypothetical protein